MGRLQRAGKRTTEFAVLLLLRVTKSALAASGVGLPGGRLWYNVVCVLILLLAIFLYRRRDGVLRIATILGCTAACEQLPFDHPKLAAVIEPAKFTITASSINQLIDKSRQLIKFIEEKATAQVLDIS